MHARLVPGRDVHLFRTTRHSPVPLLRSGVLKRPNPRSFVIKAVLRRPAKKPLVEKTISPISRIQIKRQSYIPLTKELIWELCQEMCEKDWCNVRPVIAGLECIHQYECQLEGDTVLDAFTRANEMEHVVGNVSNGEPYEKDSLSSIDSSFEENPRLNRKPSSSVWDAVFGFSKTSNHRSKKPEDSLEEEEAKQYKSINQKARDADRHFIYCLKNLLSRAHYDPLDIRDVALSRSLNSEYLSQIFIKTDTSKMDAGFVGKQMNEDLPAEVRPMLTFKRGYGSKTEYRRLLLPVVDYLQLLVVKSAFNSLKDGAIALWNLLTRIFRHITNRWTAIQSRDEDINLSNGVHFGSSYITDAPMREQLKIDKRTWKNMKRLGKDVLVSMNEWGISPKVISLGGGTLVTLADWGYIPRLEAIPVENFDSVWPVKDSGDPIFLERIALPNTISGLLNSGATGLFKKVKLQEPTFEHLVVVYRYQEKRSALKQLKTRFSRGESPRVEERKKIQIRIYSDIPIPIWKAVVPAKLLQFRPLDGLRLDLITIIGLVSLGAHAKFSSLIFDIVTITTIVVYAVRVILGYKKMYDRYENFLNDLLRKRTIAGQEGALAYLAKSASLHQFKQSALAYSVLSSSKSALRREEITSRIHKRIRHLEEKIHFDTEDALYELRRLGLVRLSYVAGYGEAFIALAPVHAQRKIKKHWDALLEGSVKTASKRRVH